MPEPDTRIASVVDHLFRSSAGQMVSYLTRVLGPAHLDLAEEAVQDALTKAPAFPIIRPAGFCTWRATVHSTSCATAEWCCRKLLKLSPNFRSLKRSLVWNYRKPCATKNSA